MSDGIVWTGQVNFTDSSDVGVTGVATLTLTPNIGVTNLPALVNGQSGLSPTFRYVTVNQVPFGTAVPASTWSLVTASTPGTSAVYDLTLYVNSGQQGVPGSFAISGATDLSGTPTDKYTVTWSAALSKWVVSPMLAGDIYAITPVTGFTSAAGSGTQYTLGSLTIPAQPMVWRPDCVGRAIPTGTALTKVELYAYLTDPTTGDQVGYGPGVAAAAPRAVQLQREFGAPIGPSLAYAKVAAGSAATIFFVAKQVASGVSDAWAVPASSCAFSVAVNAVP